MNTLFVIVIQDTGYGSQNLAGAKHRRHTAGLAPKNRAVDFSSTIGWQESYEQAYRACRQLRSQLNREPSDREIADCLGITNREWQEMKKGLSTLKCVMA